MISIQGAALSSGRRLLDNALSAFSVASAITSRIGNGTAGIFTAFSQINAFLTRVSTITLCDVICNDQVRS